MSGCDVHPPTIDFAGDLWWVFYLELPPSAAHMELVTEDLAREGCDVIDLQTCDPYYRAVLREPNGSYLELATSSDDVSPYVFLGTPSDRFLPPSSPEAGAESSQLLEYGKLCYRALRPLYAFAENLNVQVSMENVNAHRLTHMFCAQFLGPKMVQALGKDVLAGAPAWRIESMCDGGLLYVLSAAPDLVGGPGQFWRQARDYFSRMLPGPIEWSQESP